jgi:large subunit ribosomal protein L4
MAVAKRYTHTGEAQGELQLPEATFGIEPHPHVMWEAVRNYLANQRQGTAKVRSRGEMRGGGRKPWRQKGTGRARAGTLRSPLMVGGARAFGPKPRDYGYRLPKKVKHLALRSALSSKAGAEEIRVLADFRLSAPKTREVAAVLRSLELESARCLLVVPEHDAEMMQAARNIPNLSVLEYRLLNPYEVLHCDCLLIMESAVPKIEEVWGS